MNYTEEFANAYEELQKAIRDRSHLVPKIITDKNGHQRRVMVRPDEQKNNKRVKHTENPKDKINKVYNKINNELKKRLNGEIEETPMEYLKKLENGMVLDVDISPAEYMDIVSKLKTEYKDKKVVEKKDEVKSDIGKLPDNFYSYSKETQNNIKNAKYSIVNAKYTSNSGEVTEHKIAVAMIPGEFNSFEDAKDVVQHSILYGTYGSGGKKEIQSVKNVSPYEFEKITGKKVGDYANQAAERDYSYISLKKDMVAAVQKEDEEDI